MQPKVKVKTNGDSFASLEYEGVLVEIEQDGDSPNCPNSWTWGLWFDGEYLEGTSDEASLYESVKDAIASIDEIIGELSVMSEHLKAYDVLCGKLRESS